MGHARKQRNLDRSAIVAAVQAKQKREERRRNFWIYGTSSVVILALIVTVVSVFVVNQETKSQISAAADKPIDGVQSFDGLSRNHTSSEVAYPQNPPVGGDHAPQLVNCGIYTDPVNTGEALHSLEHGAVWVTYRADLPQKEIDALAQEAASHPYELLSPYPDLPSPVVATAWGKQLKLDSANDPRLPVFLQAYLQGPQTPEPGAPCSGGSQG
ncbi:DUF3105 domain-containing protein [Cryobacterium sp. TMS1-13-1]|uniref:DUF3105 domain-containing protein n=1 Tax=Cryobacterium sp. TMS1-13-1 TaxID=1259220 RepID=UPI00106A11B2|nr:DUF3105 domain-containing protein [Cryobacterium sp. TMS1-13-1]TFD21507.1 DUF3105 domain-containing protein [Cryobacterium sp. TMS1-13-1]